MKIVLSLAFAAFGAMLALAPAQATTIDFAAYAAGTTIDAPLTFGDLTFTSTSGTLLIDEFGAGKAICAFDGVGCSGTLVLQSTNGISNLTLTYSGDDISGSSILYEGQTAFLSFIGGAVADGNPATTGFVGVGFPGLTLLGLSSNDLGGVAFSGFNFIYDSTVPEPASWMLMIGGFGLIGAALRRGRPPIVA